MVLGRTLLLLVVLAVCEGLVRGGVIASLYLPAPTDVLGEVGALLGGADGFYHDLAVTLQEFLLGYLLAVVAGIGAGLFLALVPVAEEFFRPFLAALMAVPKVTVIPLLTLWLGLGLGHKVVIVFLFCFFPIVYNTIAGVKQTSREHLKVARSFRASRTQTIVKVVLPSAMPTILASLRIEAAHAIVGAIFGEMVASEAGLGNSLTAATSLYDTPRAFALIIAITLLSVAAVGIVDRLERTVFLKWRPHPSRLQ